MARRQARLPAKMSKYYVYDAAVKRYLGGFPVKDDETGKRYVMLTDDQAAYFIRNGTIGTVSLDDLQGEARRQVHQISGGRIPMTEADFERGRVRERQVLTMGAYGLPGKKIKVATERNAVQDPATNIDNVIKNGGMVNDASISASERARARRSSTQIVFQQSEGMTKRELAASTVRPIASSKG